MNTKILALITLIMIITGCGGGIDGTGGPLGQEVITVSGAAQKGPFVIGSSILVSILNSDGTSTDQTIQTQTSDSVGNFSFETGTATPVLIQASGYHLNEVTGQLSSGELTLRAIFDLTDDPNQTAFVNILTHLIHNRVLQLMSDGNSTSSAISQAQNDLIDAFEEVFDRPSITQFSDLSVYDVDNSDTNNNGYLLAVSAAAYQYAINASMANSSSVDAEITALLNNLSSDLANDGQLNETISYLQALNVAKTQLDTNAVEQNLVNNAISTTGSSINVPDLNAFLGGITMTSPADEAYIHSLTTIRTMKPASLETSNHKLLVDGVDIGITISDLSEFSWNPYFWGDNNRHTLLVTAQTSGLGLAQSNLISVTVSDSVNSLLELNTPAAGTEFKNVNQASLTWNELDSASAYEVQFSTSESFSTIINTISTTQTSTPLSNLTANQYFWRVRASNGDRFGPWTDALSFTISPPTPPTLSEPTSEKVDATYSASFTWSTDTPEGEYELQVATDPGFSSFVVNEIKTTGSHQTNLDTGTYYCRVRAINQYNHQSTWSQTQTLYAGVFKYELDLLDNKNESAQTLLATSDSFVFGVKDVSTNYAPSLHIVKTNHSGEKDWAYEYNIDDDDWSYSISNIIDIPEGYLISARAVNLNRDFHTILFALSSAGELLWEADLGEFENSRYEITSLGLIDQNTVSGLISLHTDDSTYEISLFILDLPSKAFITHAITPPAGMTFHRNGQTHITQDNQIIVSTTYQSGPFTNDYKLQLRQFDPDSKATTGDKETAAGDCQESRGSISLGNSSIIVSCFGRDAMIEHLYHFDSTGNNANKIHSSWHYIYRRFNPLSWISDNRFRHLSADYMPSDPEYDLMAFNNDKVETTIRIDGFTGLVHSLNSLPNLGTILLHPTESRSSENSPKTTIQNILNDGKVAK